MCWSRHTGIKWKHTTWPPLGRNPCDHKPLVNYYTITREANYVQSNPYQAQASGQRLVYQLLTNVNTFAPYSAIGGYDPFQNNHPLTNTARRRKTPPAQHQLKGNLEYFPTGKTQAPNTNENYEVPQITINTITMAKSHQTDHIIQYFSKLSLLRKGTLDEIQASRSQNGPLTPNSHIY